MTWVLKNREGKYLSAIGYLVGNVDVTDDQVYAFRIYDRNKAAKAALESAGRWRLVKLVRTFRYVSGPSCLDAVHTACHTSVARGLNDR